jgi:hypothetical protein
MKKTAVKLVALVATALLLLSGCAQNNPNVAATVGTQQITISEVDAIARVVAANQTETTTWGTWRAPVLQVILVSKLAAQAKELAGVTVTDAQRQQVYAQNTLYTALAKDPATTAFMSELADATLVINDTNGQKALAQVLSGVPVVVNPTFGTWDATQAKLSGESGSLSQELSS